MKHSIDLSCVKSKEEFHSLLAALLHFPPYYGKNLDALFDVLTDPSVGAVEIEFTGVSDFEVSLGADYLAAVKNTFWAAMEEGAAVSVEFCR